MYQADATERRSFESFGRLYRDVNKMLITVHCSEGKIWIACLCNLIPYIPANYYSVMYA